VRQACALAHSVPKRIQLVKNVLRKKN
jgi:hypothetical protein